MVSNTSATRSVLTPDQHARCVSRSCHTHATNPTHPTRHNVSQSSHSHAPPCQISGFQQPQPPSCESILTKPRPRTTNRLNHLSCPSRTGRQLADMTDNTSTKPVRKVNTQIAHNTDANIRLFAGVATIMVLCVCAVAWLVVLRRRETARRAIPAQTREESR